MVGFRRAPGKPGVRSRHVSPPQADGSRDTIGYSLRYQEVVMEATSGLEPE